MRVLLGLALSLLWATLALAQERITNYAVNIDVETSGDIVITETIDIVSQGNKIRRGIFREMPANYEFMGVKLPYDYELMSVTRDGRDEPVSVSRNGNAITWRVGDANVLLPNGPHRYQFEYRVADAILHHRGETDPTVFDDYDELYWNVIGHYWDFPIERAQATVRLPLGAEIIDTYVNTGRFGQRGSKASTDVAGRTVLFQAVQPLSRREGMTVSVSLAPGTIAPMSEARAQQLFWIRHGAKILLLVGGLAIFAYYYLTWSRVGRDPQSPPVFARYEPPARKDGRPYSPAAVHYVDRNGFRRMDAFSSLLMQLGIKGVLDIDAEKKRTTITQISSDVSDPDAQRLLSEIMAGRGGELVLSNKPDNRFHTAVRSFHRHIAKLYGKPYRDGNLGWLMLGIAASVLLSITVLAMPVSKSGLLVIGLFLALAAMNILFAWLLPAPTKYGAQIRSEIEGFKLYLETAEEDRINTANPLGDRPPAMSVELYERFLPYAMALGVERPWTEQFEDTLPREAAEYRPRHVRGSAFKAGRGLSAFNKSVAATLTAGVAAAAPVSQSSSSGGFSSGRSGGGFSGGGGGGGGGGGW